MSTATLIDRRKVIDWLGIAPFMIFALMFLILPTLYLIIGAFSTRQGETSPPEHQRSVRSRRS
jgi:putative spermidine/putrescine transport system permease protein